MKKRKPNIDQMYEQAASSLERVPRTPLGTAQIASAASASKTGAGIWLLAHAKEILIGTVSFAVGVGGTLAVTHALQDKAPSQLPAEQTALVTADTLSEEPFTDSTVLYTTESSEHLVARQESQISTASSNAMASSPKEEPVKTAAPEATATSTTSEPVIIRKTIIKHDTIRMKESVVVKDTVYVIEN